MQGNKTLFDLDGRVALVTGGSRGLGLQIAEALGDYGATIAISARKQHELDAALAHLRARGIRAEAFAADASKPESVSQLVESVLAAFGQVDVLVNNAGIGAVGAFEATSMQTVRELFDTNTFGVMAMTQAVIPQMRTRQSGVIVNVTSSVTLTAMPLAAAYTASKAAIEGFTGSLALELGFFGVEVKLVEPGYGPSTRFTSNGAERMAGVIPAEYAEFAAPIMSSFGQPDVVTMPEDVADVVYAAATDTSSRLRFPAGADAVALAQSS